MIIRPLNIYTLSRTYDEKIFNVIDMIHSQKEIVPSTQSHEILSLRILVDRLIQEGVLISQMDGFFWGFKIPQIGKEFDLLKITSESCLNIELKSEFVSEQKILAQLVRNKYYLKHLNGKLDLYTVITDSMTIYKLLDNDELVEVKLGDLVHSIKMNISKYYTDMNGLFKPANYLISPFNTPDQFIQGQYFLTQNQENIKKSIITKVCSDEKGMYFNITGTPGTGKTLLLYDIAKELSNLGSTLIIHCGKMTDGQTKIDAEIENISIWPASWLRWKVKELGIFRHILVDEVHRIYPYQFNNICESVKTNEQICVFSSDPGQTLSLEEEKNNIYGEICKLPTVELYTLSEKIRMNKELRSFVINVLDLKKKPKHSVKYEHIYLNYANSEEEAHCLLRYYREAGYKFINFSKSNMVYSPYSKYEEDYDTHHVIGQEFDNVVILLDDSFYYDKDGLLRGCVHPNPNYLYSKLFYQGITRARENISIIVVNVPELFKRITSIIDIKS